MIARLLNILIFKLMGLITTSISCATKLRKKELNAKLKKVNITDQNLAMITQKGIKHQCNKSQLTQELLKVVFADLTFYEETCTVNFMDLLWTYSSLAILGGK